MSVRRQINKVFAVISVSLFLAAVLIPVTAKADLPPDVHAKVEKYKKQIAEWAANPVIVNAVKEANAKGPISGMTNAKWDELGDSDPIVLGIQSNAAGKLTKTFEDEKNVNKVTVWDEKGNMIASSTKTLIYNAASRPAFTGAMKGKAWSAPEIKPDPTTQKKSVNISAPVMDGGKVIGVMNAAVNAE